MEKAINIETDDSSVISGTMKELRERDDVTFHGSPFSGTIGRFFTNDLNIRRIQVKSSHRSE